MEINEESKLFFDPGHSHVIWRQGVDFCKNISLASHTCIFLVILDACLHGVIDYT